MARLTCTWNHILGEHNMLRVLKARTTLFVILLSPGFALADAAEDFHQLLDDNWQW